MGVGFRRQGVQMGLVWGLGSETGPAHVQGFRA